MTRLDGRVTVFDSEPAPSAVVELHNAGGDIVDQVHVDDYGNFTYHLTPGRWMLWVWDAHGHRASRGVTIAKGEHKTLDIRLEPAEGVT